ncbi:MAG TPA: outer membrane lipoprotein carrier protein LolA [Verrucomicrobiae bacterium]|nr:outer membrane lipoprotein carrier protein LolA [Verrucomicrobiae bacterium]
MVSVCAAVAAALVVWGARAVCADTTNADEFVAHQVATRTFEADLRQIFHWGFPPRHIESLGHLSYQSPDFLAIVLTNPAPELVLARGDDLYIKRDRKALARHKLAVRNGKPTQNVQFLLGFFQNGCTNFADLFDAKIGRTADQCTVTLTPKHMLQMLPLRSVENVIALPSMDVRYMRIGLILDGYITYEFSNPHRNQPLNASVFEVPKP